jgi:hypothetical protein
MRIARQLLLLLSTVLLSTGCVPSDSGDSIKDESPTIESVSQAPSNTGGPSSFLGRILAIDVETAQLKIIHLNDGSVEILFQGGDGRRAFAISNDLDKLVWGTGGKTYLIQVDGSRSEGIIDGSADDVSWSPDGKSFATEATLADEIYSTILIYSERGEFIGDLD